MRVRRRIEPIAGAVARRRRAGEQTDPRDAGGLGEAAIFDPLFSPSSPGGEPPVGEDQHGRGQLHRHRHHRQIGKQSPDEARHDAAEQQHEGARRQSAAPAPPIGERQCVGARIFGAEDADRAGACRSRGLGERRRGGPAVGAAARGRPRLADRAQEQVIFETSRRRMRVLGEVVAQLPRLTRMMRRGEDGARDHGCRRRAAGTPPAAYAR